MRIKKGSLEVYESFNAFYLYAEDEHGDGIYIGCLGDELPENIEIYEPNEDKDLIEAYELEEV